ncbi:MAG: L-lactate dehydrogenase [Nanoarchaeota archaeon]|nr:L-lactate dehydrogenase [Nanoarchaeota archaeon]
MKVAIIGAGFVGSTAAYALMIDGCASDISLIDINKEKAEGEALDLKHGTIFTPGTRITYGDSYALCKDASIIIITAGANQKPGETRLDLGKKNSAIIREMLPKIAKENKDAILLMVTNPLDVLTYLAVKTSGYPTSRVFGTGTLLDTARFRQYLSEYYGVNSVDVHAYILGEHGDSEFPVWSTANISGIRLKDFKRYKTEELDLAFEKTRTAAYEIISKKGATYYAIGLAIAKIVRVILTDQETILPVSCFVEDYYGITDVCLSLPCIVGKTGIKETVHPTLDEKERESLKKSANVIKKAIKEIL